MRSGGAKARAAREKQASRLGQRMPARKPEKVKTVTPFIEEIIGVWSFLQTARASSMGDSLLPIRADAILAYCTAYGWVGENRYILIELIRAVDMAYLEHINKKLRSRANASR